MKKTLIFAGLLAGALSGYSQGAIDFGNYMPGFKQQIFNSQPTPPANGTFAEVAYGGYSTVESQGSSTGSLESPAGTVAYAAGTALSGTGFDAQLLGAAGAGDSLSQLSPLKGTTTSGILNFYTTAAAAGFIKNSDVVAVPGTYPGSPAATIAIAVWDNGDGLYNSLQAAQMGGEPWGISPLSTINTTFTPDLPASMASGSNLDMSFSLAILIPEPSTMALGVTGASALLLRFKRLRG